jgi:hypothetical protein
MKKYIGLIVGMAIIVISFMFLKDLAKIVCTFIGIIVGLMITFIARGIEKHQYARAVLYAMLVAFIGGSFLFFVITSDLGQKLDFQFWGSYAVDFSEVKNYVNEEEGVPFAYLLQLETWGSIISNDTLNENHLVLTDEIFDDINNNVQDKCVLVSLGREIENIRYFPPEGKLGAGVTFSEEYQDNMVYIYFEEPQFFDIRYFRIGDEKISAANANFGNAVNSIG